MIAIIRAGARGIEPGAGQRLIRLRLGQRRGVGERIVDGGRQILRAGRRCAEHQGQGRQGAKSGTAPAAHREIPYLKVVPGLIPSALKAIAAGQNLVNLA